MSFTARTAYGLVALLELASLPDDGAVLQVGEIARRQSIPERYLEQMLASLRQAGLLRSLRGPRGGYRLARHPSQICLAEVVECLEGKARGDGRQDPATPEFAVVASLEMALQRCRSELLAGRTLAGLLEERELFKATPVMYFI